MTLQDPAFDNSDLGVAASRAVLEALAEPPQRVRALMVGGRRLWLKRVERPGWLRRLQKGDPGRAFEADRGALRLLRRAGLPVVPILADGPDFVVMPDVGQPLAALIRDPAATPGARIAAFRAAGAALAALHGQGYSHGRPSIRDVCWDGQAATFIDLERFSPARNRTSGFTADVVVLIYSIFVYGGPDARREAAAAAEAYRAAAPEGLWQAAQARAARMGWLRWLAGLVLRLRPRSREVRAVAPTLAFMAQG